MNHQLICSWLGLSSATWPPDHYRLLGLTPGAVDPGRVEQLVQERMERVRRYQLTHPELATEAMTRLAQALNCLTDPATKRAYDSTHFPGLVPVLVASDLPVDLLESELVPLEPPPVRVAP